MLHLLKTPAWTPPDAPPQLLPPTLPAALLVVLGASGGWVSREALAHVFWPDASPRDALHHVRINLHRARQLLDRWGQAEALLAERTRVCLNLPTDTAALQAAGEPAVPGAPGTAGATQELPNPSGWLQGWRLPGHDGFLLWCDDTAQALHRAWLARSRHAQPATAARAGGLAPAAPPGRDAVFERLRASTAPAAVVVGEPGAGKSTLLMSAFAQAPCLRGLEGLHRMPYRPLLDSLRAQHDSLARVLRDPTSRLRPYRLDLARVLPELAPDEALPPLDAVTAQTRLVEALTLAFEALAPVLLVDDLQWCDAATLEWLLMLAHTGRLRWRAAARRHAADSPLAQALAPLRSAGRLEEIDLAPLSRSALATACRTRWPQQGFSEEALDRLHALSAGNPFALGELVAAGPGLLSGSGPLPQQARQWVQQLVQQRLQRLPELARLAVQAAAVLVQAVPDAGLRALVGVPAGEAGDAVWTLACAQALAGGMLAEQPAGASHQPGRLACAHDLIREATATTITAARRPLLHRQAALWLATQDDGDALTIAAHWQAAGEPQTALAWHHRGAGELKARGRFDEARALWREVAEASLDAAQALRARLELAACELLVDLPRGEAALDAVHAQVGAVADPEQQRQIEGRVLAALVDNRVFAGDLAQAQRHAVRLRELLPALPAHERAHALEVLIELAMREPDIPAAWALLTQLRGLTPGAPALLSFEGQIHWFGGQVQAAHEALARLLERHPDHCRGITIENDLAVMLHALGRLAEAEAMARRSLLSWAGVAHTETLSLLVLGSVLTSAGRHGEAAAALRRALALAREQGSAGFEAEALVRHARLHLQCGQAAHAAAALDAAAPLLADSPEPLRVSQWLLAQVLCVSAQGWPADVAAQEHRLARLLERLRELTLRSTHPWVHVRQARAAAEVALRSGDAATAHQAALAQAEAARRGGLLEPQAEAWLLQARALQQGGQGPAAWQQLVVRAGELATRQGFADLTWRAAAWLARLGERGTANPAADAAADTAAADAAAALRSLDADATGAAPFNPAAAAQREPWGRG